MGKTKAFLGDQPLAGSAAWSLVSGTRPYATTVMLSRGGVAKLLSGGAGDPPPNQRPGSGQKQLLAGTNPAPTPSGGAGPKLPVTLSFKGREFRNVYILHRAPGPNPFVAAVTIADRRWLWSYAAYKRSFNVTRKVGDQRLVSPNQLDAVTIDPKQAYKLWSLDGNRDTPWTARRVLEDLADAIKQFEQDEVGISPEIILPDVKSLDGAALPIQNLELAGPLDAAIERALSYLPGLDVYVNAAGAVVFFWRTAFGEEATELVPAGSEIQNRGHIEQIDFSRIRPRKYRVYFEIEAELKFKAEELAAGATTDTTHGPDDMFCENVLPIPDYSVTLRGQTLTTGCYLPINDAFEAWGSFPGGFGLLTKQRACQWFVPFINAWDRLEKRSNFDANANWVARIGALRAHFRTTFRINPAWVDRFADVHAYRVGTINTETGTRGTASVFSDFAYMPTQRSFAAELQNANGHAFGYAYGVPGYPSGGVITDATIASPATLEFLDADQGVFHVTYNPDKFGLYTVALPSQIENLGQNTSPGTLVSGTAGPTTDLGLIGRRYSALAFNMLGRFQNPTQLTAAHALLAIVTATPGSPNSKRSMAYVDIPASDVVAFPGRAHCDGPMCEIIIPASMETARVAWKDNEAERIKSIFTNQITAPIGKDEPFALRDLVLNYGTSSSGGTDASAGGAVSITAIAKAEATRRYHADRDRSVGSAEFNFHDAAELRGAATKITHSLASTGTVTTRYDLPGRLEPLALDRFLPSSLVRIMRKMLHIGK